MWKFLSRGVKETLERGLRVVRPPEKNVKNEGTQHTTYCKKFTPCFLQTITKYGFANKEKSNENHKHGSAAHDAEKTILGAVSYSGALALGWILTQPCHWRKWWCHRDKDKNCKRPSLFHLLGKVANSQPVTVGIHTGTSYGNHDVTSNDVVDGAQFGPKTAEEVLDEAAEELRAVHDSIIATSENMRGVDYISAKRNREALSLFRSASLRGNASAAYNLAKCYEMGIGTKLDLVQAVKWYKIAADKGHATAKYNLGVFYAHGWGGLEANDQTAKKLFEEAAEKGQPDAKAALSLSKSKQSPIIIDQAESKDWGLAQNTNEVTDENIQEDDSSVLYKMALAFESFPCNDITTPHVIMNLHKMASDKGHKEAKARFQLLEAYDAVGLLPEFFGCKSWNEPSYNVIKGTSAVVLL